MIFAAFKGEPLTIHVMIEMINTAKRPNVCAHSGNISEDINFL